MLQPRSALLLLYVAVIITSINGVFARAIPLDAVTITQVRCAIAAVGLAAFAYWQRTSFQLQRTRHYLVVVGLGVLMACHWSAFFKGMQLAGVAIGVLAHYSYPVLTVILEPLLDRRAPSPRDLAAGLVVIVGIALMVPEWNIHSEMVAGVMCGFISAMTYSTRNVLQRRWVRGETGSAVMFYQVIVVALVTLPFCNFAAVVELNWASWQMLLALGLISTALSHTLIAATLRALTAKTVSLISCLQPPVAILLSWLILHEAPAAQTLVGGSLILATALYESLRTHRASRPP